MSDNSPILKAIASLPDSLTPDQFLWQAVELIATEAGLYLAAVYLCDFNDALFYICAGSGEAGRILHSQGHRFSIQSPAVEHTILYNKITLIDDLEGILSFFSVLPNEQGEPTLLSTGTEQLLLNNPRPSSLIAARWWLCLPLHEAGLSGILCLYSAAQSPFTPSEILTFHLLAEQIEVRIKEGD